MNARRARTDEDEDAGLDAVRPTAPLLLRRRLRAAARDGRAVNLERTMRVTRPELAGSSQENLAITRPAPVPAELLALARGDGEAKRPARRRRRRVTTDVAIALVVGAIFTSLALWIAGRRAAPHAAPDRAADSRPAPSAPW